MYNSTLCYIEDPQGNYLMLHRVKKKNDLNHDKWVGVGGKFEDGESPEECVLRETWEETGLTLTDYQYRGLVTFVSDQWETEYMHVFTATGWTGELIECNEGVLEWIHKDAHHAMNLGYRDKEVDAWFYKGLAALAREHSVEEWLALIMEFGQVNFQCMALLDRANTETFGDPVPTRVNIDVKKGPFIVVSGHDLEDLHQLLEQTAGRGVNVYTHCEMLPAHGYPGLKKYPHLAGNFGTAWQNQQKEFADIPAPVLFTTNCLMPPRPSYADRVYTTSVVGYDGLRHIAADAQGRKDFSPLIRQAQALGGYQTDQSMSGVNGGHMLTTGFAHAAVLDKAPQIIEAIRSGAVKHIFLVGGCDGAHPGRNYYTEFVKRTPMDSLVLTLACGKFRFNDLDLGEIGGIPRILDVGQCNDAYSAVQIALALADAFHCTVNDLPLTLVLSWYEQKAVCILLSLLALGVKNIYLGPTLPAFLSETVVKTLVDAYGLQPITAPQQDLDAILHRG